MTVLYLMCGIPGSGKSTWIKQNKIESDAVISRDVVRFSLVKEHEEYFSKETEVFYTFIDQINEAIDKGVLTIFVDATHINENSRNKVLDLLHLSDEVKVTPVFIKEDLATCLSRNDLREGRANVPSKVIAQMHKNLRAPTFNEKHRYASIIIVEQGSSTRTWNSGENPPWKDPEFHCKDYSSNEYPKKSYKINLKEMESLYGKHLFYFGPTSGT